MEALRKIVKVVDNRIEITVPPAYNGTEVELIILRSENASNELKETKSDYFQRYYGSIKSQLSQAEVDAKLKALREEWNRTI